MAHGPVPWTDRLYAYYQTVGYREVDLLKNLRFHFREHPKYHQHTRPETAQCLSFLVQLMRPAHILEIGTFIGYSTLAMALAMPEACTLITCDRNQDLVPEVRPFWDRAPNGSNIHFHGGDAQNTMKTFYEQGLAFDMIYIDANKKHYDAYYESGLPLLKEGGVIALDNTLSAGHVADSNPSGYVHNIKSLNEKIHQDSRVNMLLLPVGDGLTVVLKRLKKK